MPQNNKTIAIIYPAGRPRLNTSEKEEQIKLYQSKGFNVVDIEPMHESLDGYSSAPDLERAAMFAHALTSRKYPILWAARGGYGSTGIIKHLDSILPPVLPPKILIGFSDISFLGAYLNAKYPNFTYIHAANFFDKHMFMPGNKDAEILFKIIAQDKQSKSELVVTEFINDSKQSIQGYALPFNLSMAESYAALSLKQITNNSILFLEEVNEELYRVMRKIDSLYNSGFLSNISAIVLGQFTGKQNSGHEIEIKKLLACINYKTKLPVFSMPLFGHSGVNQPIVLGSKVHIMQNSQNCTIELTYTKSSDLKRYFKNLLEQKQHIEKNSHIHFMGIGGTGMAAVAGIFKSDDYAITGSDTPIYPPMSDVLTAMEVKPFTAYLESNITETKPEYIICSNVITRKNAELKTNPELEYVLQKNIPMFSFPSALRNFFLKDSLNIVVSGTHGKTTTSSLIAQCLDFLGEKPSFFIGGATNNFKVGYRLNSKKLFVLEGDEYDTAFFDKGPKFLHYEPAIALLNNIEFDHADIYPDLPAIEREFTRLAELTSKKDGIIIANIDDARVAKIAKNIEGNFLCFGQGKQKNIKNYWQMQNYIVEKDGIVVEIISPWGKKLSVKSTLFGMHNALNITATFAVLHAHYMFKQLGRHSISRQEFADLLTENIQDIQLEDWQASIKSFLGVKRRFELIGIAKKNIAVFDDFAHHPTAISTTLEAFQKYISATKRKGKLIACFDPRNATMRRNVLQADLIKALAAADQVLIGKVPQDMRIDTTERLDGNAVAKACGTHAQYFDNNDNLCKYLVGNLQDEDTVVFMSSGAFDNLPHKLFVEIAK